MKWNEITIKTNKEAADAVSYMLTTIGARGTAIVDPNDIRAEISNPCSLDYVDSDFLSSLGEDVVIKAYFSAEINISDTVSLIDEKLNFINKFLKVGKGYCGYRSIKDEDWSSSWKKYYKPFEIAEGLIVKPTWEDYDIKGSEKVIVLDPGAAFGTGIHETTKMCSVLLNKYLRAGDRAIDVGCGSGILSLVASKLGAKHVMAVDVDKIAVEITRKNCILNGVGSTVFVTQGEIRDLKKEKADIIVANNIADVIIKMSEELSLYLKKYGFLLLQVL